ncbi:lasso peptide biosynthesis B2 protein [Rubellimicrobium aerolatum]|uniref:Lasso peptide biosynthesis B2 protein n=1 Tax=Rubellimicrobium aerolatum TaxID=490979 RepID=A0ABW0S953_9RHOB|nr:lasso peptide biosynthesis B2 protein [Rubellimicrobium aerolatum]MBP1804835.1 hypothetical protein [Rubellimicrobium aerolatum]
MGEGTIRRLGPLAWADLLRAALELGAARMLLRRRSCRDLIRMTRARTPAQPIPETRATRVVERVAFAVPRVAARVPWRADCLVQALAAQSWLTRAGVESELRIGARQEDATGFEAHAWLTCGPRVVTGGGAGAFAVLVGPDTPV